VRLADLAAVGSADLVADTLARHWAHAAWWLAAATRARTQ
jgi:hypothetical protein